MNISTKDKILDISQNLARIGNWTADSYEQKRNLIDRFILQTQEHISNLKSQKLNSSVREILEKFEIEFEVLIKQKINKQNREEFAEKYLTWANILQHKSSTV
jgi:hypothetical protein